MTKKSVIKVKITPMGGYVIGDGPCPFDPDEFLCLFGNKIIEAGADGFEISQEEVAQLKRAFNDVVHGTAAKEYKTSRAVRKALTWKETL